MAFFFCFVSMRVIFQCSRKGVHVYWRNVQNLPQGSVTLKCFGRDGEFNEGRLRQDRYWSTKPDIAHVSQAWH